MAHPTERFKEDELHKCIVYNISTGSFYTPNKTDYDKVFKAHPRNLPFELSFLALMGTSFVMYVISSIVYIAWKSVIGNIYIVR